MQKRKVLASVVVAIVLTSAVPAHALGWVAVLKNTPAEQFDEDDIGMFLVAAKTALDAEGAPKETAWRNDATGAGGRFLPLATSKDARGNVCKRVRFWVHARNRSEKSTVWTACQIDNRWRLTKAS